MKVEHYQGCADVGRLCKQQRSQKVNDAFARAKHAQDECGNKCQKTDVYELMEASFSWHVQGFAGGV